MSAKNKNISIIEHILGYCNDIDEIVQRFGEDCQIFKADKAYCNAVCMCLLQIGELSKHLTEAFRTEYSEVPWKEIRGMRNIFAHDYGSIDVSEVWATVQRDVPMLKGFCEAVVRRYTLMNEDALKFDHEDESLWEKEQQLLRTFGFFKWRRAMEKERKPVVLLMVGGIVFMTLMEGVCGYLAGKWFFYGR